MCMNRCDIGIGIDTEQDGGLRSGSMAITNKAETQQTLKNTWRAYIHKKNSWTPVPVGGGIEHTRVEEG